MMTQRAIRRCVPIRSTTRWCAAVHRVVAACADGPNGRPGAVVAGRPRHQNANQVALPADSGNIYYRSVIRGARRATTRWPRLRAPCSGRVDQFRGDPQPGGVPEAHGQGGRVPYPADAVCRVRVRIHLPERSESAACRRPQHGLRRPLITAAVESASARILGPPTRSRPVASCCWVVAGYYAPTTRRWSARWFTLTATATGPGCQN